MAKSICPACDRVFHNAGSFDKHRTGKHEIYPRMPGFKQLPLEIQAQVRRCMTDEEMLAASMLYDQEHNVWISEIMEPEAKERLKKASERIRAKKQAAQAAQNSSENTNASE